MIIKEYSSLIDQLKPLVMEEHFQELFDQLTANESSSDRFLIKMELNRLATLCTRNIDLREKTELPWEAVVQGQQKHFLDEPAKAILLESLSLYQQHYTLGVYEEVINSHKRRREALRDAAHKKVTASQDSPFVVPLTVLGSYFNREEERMHYSIKVDIQHQDQRITANSTDLSVNGIRIRAPKSHNLQTQAKVKLFLLELIKDGIFEVLQQGIDYQVVKIESKDDSDFISLKRLDSNASLSELLEQLIHAYKGRYKVDVSDIMHTATGLGLERQYLPHFPHLSTFAGTKNQQWHLSHLLLSQENQTILNDFVDQNDINQLPAMLTHQRIEKILQEPSNPAHKMFVCFSHNASGKLFFYSATLWELEQQTLTNLFLGFGARKTSFRIYRLDHYAIDHQRPYKASVLPQEDRHYSSAIEAELKQLQYSLVLQDLTNEQVRRLYQSRLDTENVNALKVFAQPKINSHQIRQVAMEFSERRMEARFAFKTLVHIRQGDIDVKAISQDISGRGMQLNLDDIIEFNNDEPLLLSFPKLQPLAGKLKLVEMPYKLVRSRRNGQSLHLVSVMGNEPHMGVAFLKKLIEANKEKLQKLTENNAEAKELAEALKNLMMRHLPGVLWFVEKTIKNAKLSCLAATSERHLLTDIFDTTPYGLDLTALLDHGVLKRDLLDPVRTMNPDYEMDFFEVFMSLLPSGELLCQQPRIIGDINAQLKFIRQAQDHGQFYAIRVYRGAAHKPDMSYIRRETEYMLPYAPHKVKQLEEMLWQVIGLGEILDITHEVLLRYPSLSQH
ncbi:PilZ domain-containing protein [Shewanella sp. NIFS-20-20]|uniref:PilZ domain-containing protein n=1 Tax=Shewanella sp. NIFS-20-20 TaxID=2853806 RepID=UPI001C437F22|nr:PilZ domain-containing protein [Shewanella sp. NIFS-20-20]MBV7314937.1 PilZ domain-containing protein [Shewanella sp. NIFS-20-20]